jgi:glycosyltransferase involved in cell wall biosynthesis
VLCLAARGRPGDRPRFGAAMRILIVTHYWHPHRGGVETVAREQARRLVQRGHHVSVITSRLRGDPELVQDDGFPVYRVSAVNLLERLGIPYPFFSPRLVSLFERLMPVHDVVLIHGHSFMGSALGALMARRHDRPAVLLQHNPYIQYPFPWSIVERGADLLQGRYSLRSVTSVLAISEYTARYVRALVPGRTIRVVSNGVSTTRFSPVNSSDEQLAIRERLGLPSECFIVFTVRRLVYRNGLDTLVAACAGLRKQRDLLVVIGGGGPERRSLERRIRLEGLSNVRLIGPLPDELLPDFYRAADAFVLPTRTGEGFGLAVLEAFASGLPVIATRGGGQQEIVCEGRTGLLVPAASPGAMAEAIVRLQSRPELAYRMGRAGRATALAMDWERCVDELEGILVEMTKGGSVPSAAHPRHDGSARLAKI